MRKSKFSEHQIIAILKQWKPTHGKGRVVSMRSATHLLPVESKYRGMQALDIKCLRELEDENGR